MIIPNMIGFGQVVLLKGRLEYLALFRLCPSLLPERNGHIKRATLAQLAFHPHPAFMALSDGFDDCQPQAGTLAFLGFFLTTAVELLENPWEVDWCDAYPGVTDCEYHLVFIWLDAH